MKLFNLASTAFDADLADKLESVFLEGDNFPNGEQFVFEEVPDILESLNDLDTEKTVKPRILLDGVGPSYRGKSINALTYVLEEEGLVDQNGFNHVKPSTYNPLTDHAVAEETVRGLRFDTRRKRGVEFLEEEEDLGFYFGRVDQDTCRDVLLMSPEIAAGLSGYQPNSGYKGAAKEEILSYGFYCIENSDALSRLDLEPDKRKISNTFKFLLDLGIGRTEDDVYIPGAISEEEIGLLNNWRSEYNNTDNLWSEEGYNSQEDTFEETVEKEWD